MVHLDAVLPVAKGLSGPLLDDCLDRLVRHVLCRLVDQLLNPLLGCCWVECVKMVGVDEIGLYVTAVCDEWVDLSLAKTLAESLFLAMGHVVAIAMDHQLREHDQDGCPGGVHPTAAANALQRAKAHGSLRRRAGSELVTRTKMPRRVGHSERPRRGKADSVPCVSRREPSRRNNPDQIGAFRRKSDSAAVFSPRAPGRRSDQRSSSHTRV